MPPGSCRASRRSLALDGITSVSTVPIRLVAWLGFALVVFCVIVLGWAMYERLCTRTVPQGWTSLLVVVLLLGGVQLLSLGIIGQYVARIFEEASSGRSTSSPRSTSRRPSRSRRRSNHSD